ncbi:MAG: hypothetical protein LUG85_05785 [Clostridiales bacterium]|nr:hypothetical protein [Clostridiales bacterium]MCD7828029.1 hypothetical protein [Clostridiales bacterium]
MSSSTWSYLSIVFFVAAAVFMIIAIVMFFMFNIRKIRRELSGKYVVNYMEDYNKSKENKKRVEIYDPSGKLISNVTTSNVAVKSNTGRTGQRIAAKPAAGAEPSMGDRLASSKASASVKSENATRVLTANDIKYEGFKIIKDYVFAESKEYIG